MPQTRIGISGWRYAPWRGTFYPEGLPQRRELAYAASRLNSIEINGSFYSLQRPEYYRQWCDETPADFVFSVKGGRYITHLRRLKDVRTPLANFLASGVLALGEKLGPILWQFPPMFQLKLDRFAEFFEMLPRDTRAAAELARSHDGWMKGRTWLEADRPRPLRHAVEVRHHSFLDAGFVKLCRKHNVALVFADTAGKWPYAEDVTADFVYARLHGDKEIYVSGYGDEALDWWAARLRAWRAGGEPADARRAGGAPAKLRAKGRDVFVYFDNDVKVRAPFDAEGLARRLGVVVVPPDDAFAAARLPSKRKMKRAVKRAAATARTSWPAFRSRRAASGKPDARPPKPTRRRGATAKRKRPASSPAASPA